MTQTSVERKRIDVSGACELLDAFDERVHAGAPPGLAAARALVDVQVDWRSARDAIVTSARSVVLAEHTAGSVLAARFLAPTDPTAIHDHGHAGAALVVEGHDRYERFIRTGETKAVLESLHNLASGDLMWWNAPPDDLHRQHGVGAGAIELVLLAGLPTAVTELPDATPPAPALRVDLVDGYIDGDTARLARWYDDAVLVDANVPEWRFQVRGCQSAMDLLDNVEFNKADRRVTFLRATDTDEGLLLETESRFTEAGELCVCREIHNLRVRDERIFEHVVWCTGVAFDSTARSQLETAPMERP